MIDTTPWLSVVTVVKDDISGFQVTAESIARQIDRGFEWIVVDSSVVRTEIKMGLAVLSLRVPYRVEWQEPQGIYSAMNKGLELAKGKYVYFLNAGDSLMNQQTLGQVHEIVTRESPAWFVGHIEIEETSGNRVKSSDWNYSDEKQALFARGHFPPHQGTVIKTELLREIGGFNESYFIAADYACALSLSKISDPLMTDLILARFIEGGVSTEKRRDSFREFHRARREIFVPRGLESIKEYLNYWRQVLTVAVVSKVRSR